MTQSRRWYRGAVFGWIVAILAIAIGLLIFLNKRAPQNSVAELELKKIGAVWFVPAKKNDGEIIWLDDSHIKPLYQLFSSQDLEHSPAKWVYVGRVGFTYPNGRVASVKLFDTNSDQGAFSCGSAYFRYKGRIPDCILNANNKSIN